MKMFGNICYVMGIVVAMGIGMSTYSTQATNSMGSKPPCNEVKEEQSCTPDADSDTAPCPNGSKYYTSRLTSVDGFGHYGPSGSQVCTQVGCASTEGIVAVDCGE